MEFIPAVEDGAREALQAGPLSGFPIVDVKLTLTDGTFHDVDSSKMSFAIAGSMATKTLVSRAHVILLEPVMNLEVVTPGDYLGEVIGDLGRRRAQIQNIEGTGDIQAVRARIPLGESFGYANSLRSLTQGRASYNMEFYNYLEVPKGFEAEV